MKINTEDRITDLKDIVFDLLKGKVDTFTVRFDGSGDSGQIEEIELDENICEMPVEGIKLSNGIRYSKEGTEHIWTDAKMLADVIESVCYEVLEQVCDGWEIDDGSYGEFVFDVNERKVQLDFNERITDIRSSTYDF